MMPYKSKIKIIYVEDHVPFRTSIIKELESFGLSVIAQCSHGKDLITQINLRPDVILLDLEMPVMNGNETLDYLMKHWPDNKVIIVSMHYEELLVENYISRGAKGYISKDAFSGNIELLIEGIKTVSEGGTFIHELPMLREKLSVRQKEIVSLMVEGYTTKEISSEIGLVERAVEKQKQKIYHKIGGTRAIDLYKYAFSKGLQFLGIKNRTFKKVTDPSSKKVSGN